MAIDEIRFEDLDALLKAHPLAAVAFGADWCKDCRRLEMFYARVAGEFPQLWCARCKIEDGNPAWEKFSIAHIPTVIVFINGVEKDRAVETPTAALLREFFAANLPA